jgi:hypothetical protein
MAGLIALYTSTGRLNECSTARGGVFGKFESLDRLGGQQPACGQHGEPKSRGSGSLAAEPRIPLPECFLQFIVENLGSGLEQEVSASQ